jgi:hypothetical protein
MEWVVSLPNPVSGELVSSVWHVLNALVEEFILGLTGEIEIRYILPVTEKQLQDTATGMLSVDK